ncbi:hypothetical protein IWQ57_006220, partial [Coemansia nantahalensis]
PCGAASRTRACAAATSTHTTAQLPARPRAPTPPLRTGVLCRCTCTLTAAWPTSTRGCLALCLWASWRCCRRWFWWWCATTRSACSGRAPTPYSAPCARPTPTWRCSG